MTPREEIISQMARLNTELAAIALTPQNRQRIADRRRQLALCESQLVHYPEPFNPKTDFVATLRVSDDGLADEDNLDRLEHALTDPWCTTSAEMDIEELKATERCLAGWFEMPPDIN